LCGLIRHEFKRETPLGVPSVPVCPIICIVNFHEKDFRVVTLDSAKGHTAHASHQENKQPETALGTYGRSPQDYLPFGTT
jgi:hypothetical protein